MSILKRFIKRCMACFCTFDYNKYWTRREQCYAPNISRLKRRYYIAYIEAMNQQNNASIPLFLEHNIFAKGRPLNNNHGLNGIVIAGGGDNWQELPYFAPSYYRP